jgi:hypothetical protein
VAHNLNISGYAEVAMFGWRQKVLARQEIGRQRLAMCAAKRGTRCEYASSRTKARTSFVHWFLHL